VASSLLSRIVVPFPHISRSRNGERTDDLAQTQVITAHHSVSSLSDPARDASPCSSYLRAARDVDTTCTVRRNVHESLATKVRAHRAPNLLRGCVGRSHVDHTEARCAKECVRIDRRGGRPETPGRWASPRPGSARADLALARLGRTPVLDHPDPSPSTPDDRAGHEPAALERSGDEEAVTVRIDQARDGLPLAAATRVPHLRIIGLQSVGPTSASMR
jgi:hypothetical protein